MRTMLTTVLLAAAVATAALGDDGDFQWQGQLAPGQLLQIRGLNGAIHATGTADNNASITAHKTANQSDPASVNIQVVPFDGGVVVCAVYPDADPNRPNTCNPPGQSNYMSVKDNDVQVEFTVQVPQGVRLAVTNVGGDIQANALTADVDVSAIIGNITISTSGAAQATTNTGSIVASMGAVNWFGTRRFETISGNVEVQIPANSNVSVRADTIRGTVSSDFPLVTNSAPWGSTVAYGTVGNDGRSLRLSTNSGNITLRQGPPSAQ